MPKRYDAIRIDNVIKSDSGFLTYDFLAAQTGVFPYYDWDLGRVVYELKHPDDLLRADVVDQLMHLPITEDHPWELVSTDNAKEHIKGLTTGNASVQDNKLAGEGTIFDAALIGKVLGGTKDECSLGFECTIVDEHGVYEGVAYERRQTEFRLNHLAMVEQGRCGPECSARFDSANDVAVQMRTDSKELPRRNENMKTVKLDGQDYNVDDAVAGRLDTLQQENEKLTRENGQLQGKLDGKDDEIKKIKDEKDALEGTQVTAEKLDEAVEGRLMLIQDASAILDEGYDFKGKSDQEIKVDCIKVMNQDFKADGKSEDYINARFDTILEFTKSDQRSLGDNNLKFVGDSETVSAKRKDRLNMKKD